MRKQIERKLDMKYKTYIAKAHETNVLDNLFNVSSLDDYVNYNSNTYVRTRTLLIPEVACDDDLAKGYLLIQSMSHVLEKYTHNPELIKYDVFNIPKKTGGYRVIHAPEENLKKDMHEIKNMLEKSLKILSHDAAHAYIKGRSSNTAIAQHLANKSKWFLKLDIKDFFGSCSPDFLRQQLPQINNISELLTESIIGIACYENGLPQGTPLSPMLSNWLMIPFDYKLNKLLRDKCKTYSRVDKVQNYVYTRYADDILISGRESFNYDIIIADIKDLLQKDNYPFQLKDEKTRYGSNAGRNWNLGLMYNKDMNITIGHARKKRIKAGIYNYIHSTEPADPTDLRILLGELSYLRNIEPEYAEHLFAKTNVWDRVIADLKQL